MKRFAVAVIDDYQRAAEALADWSQLGSDAEVCFFHDTPADDDALIARLAPFDAIVAMRERTAFSAPRLAALPHLRLLVATGMHHQTIDFDEARQRGVTVCGTPSNVGVVTTVEHIWALILGLARNLCIEDRAIREGGWQVALGPTLHGKVLGIVGLGNLGRAIIPVGRALGMRIVAWSRNLTIEAANAAGIERLDHEDFFRSADVITVHLKLSERSVGYIGTPEFALMKPTCLVVNTSRGPVVDEAALLEALRTRRIAGAALDVFDHEPLPVDHPLRSTANTILSPHNGYASVDGHRQHYADAIEAILSFRAGAPIRVLA